MKNIKKIVLPLFLSCMLTCVVLTIISVWNILALPIARLIVGRITATLFVIGLASFLLWITTLILEHSNRT